MSFFERRKKLFREFLYDSSINIKDRSFMVFSMSVIVSLYVAVISGLVMREPFSATLSTFVGAVVFSIYVTVVYRKKRLKQGRIVLSIIVIFLFLPAMLFTNGGINSGAPLWLLLGSYYLVMILDGKTRIIMSIVNALVMLGCYITAYYHPELVTEYSRWGSFFDTYVAFIIVGIVMMIMTSFQTRLYQREGKLSEEKSKEGEAMSEAQSRFFSNMSHEIRTPINTVLGLNEIILRQEDASEEIRRDAKNIQGAGKLLLSLINDILDISKIEAGKMEIVPVDYNVGSLLSEIVNMIWLKADEKGLSFNVDIDPNVPQVLYGDEVRIKQILINLLNNAVKYTEEGSVSLHMECEVLESGEAMLNFSVSDTGAGIKPEALPQLFETFKRVDEEKNRSIEGTGLGLSIVKQLVELMDGKVKVNSVYSQGSTFEVSIKQGISSDKPIGDLNITNSVGLASAEKFEHSFHAPDARILIVDDNEMNLQVEKKLLEGTGMTIDLASSGQEALTATLRSRYDVIFMDHLMPEMDGIECYEKIRTQAGGMNLNVPIVILTANAGGDNTELYIRTGFDGILVKPVSGQQLEDMLLTQLPAGKLIGYKGLEMAGSSMNTASRYAKKKPVTIAINSTCDLPRELVDQLGISIIPCQVFTKEGIFYDNVDLDCDELIRYMKDKDNWVKTDAPTEEAYIRFFAEELKKAHHLIFIAYTSHSSAEYERAVRASKAFDNVTVVNSECLSSASGILAIIAVRLAQQNQPVEKIVSELEIAKKRLHCSFITRSTDTLARQGKISRRINGILDTLWLRPVLRMKNDRLGVGRLYFGSSIRCYEKYLKNAFQGNTAPDTSLLIVPYAGIDEDKLVWIESIIREKVNFEHLIFQKVSVGAAANCGEGTIGLQYLIKGDNNYNIGAFFDNLDEDDLQPDIAEEGNVIRDESGESEGSDSPSVNEEAVPEAKWYESLQGIDGATALKNSGSEEMLKNLMEMFCDSYEDKAEEIQSFYDTENWENYVIKVHALKSSSRLVGALKLGDDAQALEMAGKTSDIAFIRDNHSIVMDEYKKVVEVLSPLFEKKQELTEIPKEMLEDSYVGLSEFAQMEEYDLARTILDTLSEYKLPDKDAERISRIEQSLEAGDFDGVLKILQE